MKCHSAAAPSLMSRSGTSSPAPTGSRSSIPARRAAADLGAAAPEPKIGDPLSLARARKLATTAMLQLGRGIDPADEKRQRGEAKTVATMLDEFVDRYCRKEKKLRTADRIESDFERLVKPEIGDIMVYDLRRSHVTDMLDDIADENGPVMADRTLAYFRKACNWYATRDDLFNSPIIKGMARNESEARNRILTDDEIGDIWAALDIAAVPPCYPNYIKTMLVTATRRSEAAQMHSSEVEDDLWTIPGERYKRLPKHKGLDHVVPLMAQARALMGGEAAGLQIAMAGSFSRLRPARRVLAASPKRRRRWIKR